VRNPLPANFLGDKLFGKICSDQDDIEMEKWEWFHDKNSSLIIKGRRIIY